MLSLRNLLPIPFMSAIQFTGSAIPDTSCERNSHHPFCHCIYMLNNKHLGILAQPLQMCISDPTEAANLRKWSGELADGLGLSHPSEADV